MGKNLNCLYLEILISYAMKLPRYLVREHGSKQYKTKQRKFLAPNRKALLDRLGSIAAQI